MPAVAEKFSAADLLTWNEQGRNSYYSIAIEMMGAVFAQGETDYATCISDWYFKDGAVNPSARAELQRGMERFPDHDPRGIIIAWVKKICGPFPRITDR